jgi:hypothetical protein
MNDPSHAASAAGAVASGAGAALLAQLGVEPAPLFWAVAGASIGLSFAAATTRLRAAMVFAAVALLCSLFGAWLAHRYYGGEPISRNAFSGGLAIFFHPLLNAAVTRLPAAIDGLMRKFGIGSQQ